MSSYTQYQEYGGNPYTNAPNVEAGYGHGGSDHLQRPEPQHELSNYSNPSNYSADAPAVLEGSTAMSQASFLQLVDFTKQQIRELSTCVGQLATLHLRALSNAESRSPPELVALETSTQSLNDAIRRNVQKLRTDAAKDRSNNVKATQANTIKREFERQLQEFQNEELQYRQSYRATIAREYRIVNPDATDAEAQQASEMDWGNEGVFQTALKSNRSGQASAVLGSVRARHNELQKIEQTLTQLAEMFQDLAAIVEAEEPIVQRTEENAIQTQEDVAKAGVEIDKANEHARRRRRLKWWCFFIILLVLLAIGLGAGLSLGLRK